MILMIDNLQVTITLTAIWAKFVIMRWKRSAISSIVNMIAEDWMYLKINAERNVMIRQAQIARFVIISGYFMVIFGFSVVIILPSFGVHYRLLTNLTAGVRALPMQGYYFYDTDKSPQFEFTLAAQAITTFLACVTYTSVDAFLALIIFHICGQLENFRYQLLNLASSDNFANALRYNVETHLRLIRFLRALLSQYSNVVNAYIFLLWWRATYGERTNAKIVQIFIICTCIKCEAVYRALCDLEWYKWEPRESRALILLMIRASEPFRLTAGKIFPLSMVTFCSVLKTSAGYISFLLAKRN
nr:PREDICTED: uncharacterized protein LOC105676448 [Linepithema humile]